MRQVVPHLAFGEIVLATIVGETTASMSAEAGDGSSDGQRKRRRFDPIVVVFVALLAIGVAVIATVSRTSIVASAPADAGSTTPDAAVVTPPPPAIVQDFEAKLDEKPATTAKAKIMKEALRERAKTEQERAPRVASVKPPQATQVTNAVYVVIKGDDALKRKLTKALRGVELVDGAAAHGYSLGLTAQHAAATGGHASCSAAIVELPQQRLVGSLSSDADGPASAEREVDDACAESLADDLNNWLRAHR